MTRKDMLAKSRATATKTVIKHRAKIDQGITKVGEIANTKTGGRYQDQIAKSSDRVRAGLDTIASDHPDTDGPEASTPRPG